MIQRLATRLLIRPEDIPPSDERFEVVGTFNPGAVRTPEGVVLLVRVAERPRGRFADYLALPRWDPQEGLTIDMVPDADHDALDPRVVRRRADGIHRLTFISHLVVVRCGDGRQIEEIVPRAFRAQSELEEYGVEDPRITFLNGRYYFTYVSVSRHGPATSLASTVDFQTFERHGVIFCPENKDVSLFPGQIGGEYVALHRPVCGTAFSRPEMWVARSPDLVHWGQHQQLELWGGDDAAAGLPSQSRPPTQTAWERAGEAWRSGRVGGGAPPILVEQGWLEIFHGNRLPTMPGEVGTYYGGALLLDRNDPTRVIGQSSGPILVPEMDFELRGFVSEVVFPSGLVEDGERMLVYYGAADACTAVAEFARADVLAAVTREPSR